MIFIVLGLIIINVIFRSFRPLPQDILYIVQPGLNYGNQLGLVFVVVCIIGFFLTFYIPVVNNWDKEKCNDGMMFFAPLFGQDANKTLRECAQPALVQTEGKLEDTPYKFPDSLSKNIQSVVHFINEKIKAVQTSMSTVDNTIINKKLRDTLSDVKVDRETIRKISSLNSQIKNKTNATEKLKKSVAEMTKKQSEADKARKAQQTSIQKMKTVSKSDNDKLTSFITRQTTAQRNKTSATNIYNDANRELGNLKKELAKLGSLKNRERELKTDIERAKKEI